MLQRVQYQHANACLRDDAAVGMKQFSTVAAASRRLIAAAGLADLHAAAAKVMQPERISTLSWLPLATTGRRPVWAMFKSSNGSCALLV